MRASLTPPPSSDDGAPCRPLASFVTHGVPLCLRHDCFKLPRTGPGAGHAVLRRRCFGIRSALRRRRPHIRGVPPRCAPARPRVRRRRERAPRPRRDARHPGHRIESARHGRHPVSRSVDDQGLHRPHRAETARRRSPAPRCSGVRIRARDEGLGLPDRRLAADPRARPAEPCGRLRDGRSLGRSTDAAAGSGLQQAPPGRRAVHDGARNALRILQPRLRDPGPDRHQRVEGALLRDDNPHAAGAARHARVGLRRRGRAARASGTRVSLGRRRLAPRADARARHLRRHGWIADERQRLREVGDVPVVGLAAARRCG